MGSIPLPALHVNPPQPPESPMESVARLMQMKSAMGQQQIQQQQIQAGQQENQMRAAQMRDSQNIQALMPQFITRDEKGQPTGYDWNGLTTAAAQAGMQPATLEKLQTAQKSGIETVMARTNADKAKLALENEVNAQSYQRIEAVRALPPEQRGPVYQQTLEWMKSKGVPVEKLPPEPNDANLALVESGLGQHAQALADAKTAGEIDKNKAEARKSTADAMRAESQAKWAAANGMPVGVPASDIQMADWLKKNRGKGPSDYEIAMKKVVPAYNFNLQTAGAGGSAGGGNGAVDWAAEAKKMGMSSAALDQTAEKYYSTGSLPPIGRGMAGPATNKLIMNRAAALHPDGNLAATSAEFKANEKSLEGLQKNFDQVSAFEATARRNIDLLQTTAQKIPDLGARFADMPVRSVMARMVGDPNMAAFKTALNTAQTESAKVLNSANANGVLSDSARKDLQDVIDGNLPLKSMVRVLDTLRQDMSNRHVSYQEQIDDIKQRLGGKSSTQPNTTTETPAEKFAREHGGRVVK